MKISSVNVYFAHPRWGFVEIVTDTDLAGWGEAVLKGWWRVVIHGEGCAPAQPRPPGRSALP